MEGGRLSVLVVAAALLVGDALCIRCYSCSSQTNLGCVDPPGNRLQPTKCDLAAANETQRNAKGVHGAFNEVFAFDIASQKFDLPMNCLKQVTRVGGQEMVLRGCHPAATRELSICGQVVKVAGEAGGVEIAHCSLCNADGCNSAPKMAAGAICLAAALIARP